MQSVQSEDLVRLDQLLDELGTPTGTPYTLLREHLESARVYLVGLMPAEYAFRLRMAEEALDGVSDRDLRERIQEFIHGAEGEENA